MSRSDNVSAFFLWWLIVDYADNILCLFILFCYHLTFASFQKKDACSQMFWKLILNRFFWSSNGKTLAMRQPLQQIRSAKGTMGICLFLGILTQKRFRTPPNDFFRFFDFQHWKCPLVIWPCLKMLKIFETRFEIWCPKIAIRVLSAHVFVFEEILGRLRCKINLTPIATL